MLAYREEGFVVTTWESALSLPMGSNKLKSECKSKQEMIQKSEDTEFVREFSGIGGH